MNASSAEEKQAIIRQLLSDLAAAQPPALEVRLLARSADGIRGILNHAPGQRPGPRATFVPSAAVPPSPAVSPVATTPQGPSVPAGPSIPLEPTVPTGPIAPPRPAMVGVDESAVPPPFREKAAPTLDSVRLGHELHVVVSSPRGGYLHLFNLGSSGEVRRMLPRPGEAPVLLEPGRAHLASPTRSTPWVENGPVNGFPERVLAVVTAEPRALPASCLHPSFNDAAVTRGFSAPVVESLLAAWPAAAWSWGAVEARIEN